MTMTTSRAAAAAAADPPPQPLALTLPRRRSRVHTHPVQTLRRQLRRPEQLGHLGGGEFPGGVALAQAAQPRVVPLLLLAKRDERPRQAGFLLHCCRRQQQPVPGLW